VALRAVPRGGARRAPPPRSTGVPTARPSSPDEQVEGEAELCWRCDTPVEQRELEQWFLKITEYADELLEAIDDLEGWPNSVRQMQRSWIGRQYGTELDFEIGEYGPVEAFTTRVDTIHGATFFALAPDHPISEELAEENGDVRHFIEEEAAPDGDEPNGVETGRPRRIPSPARRSRSTSPISSSSTSGPAR